MGCEDIKVVWNGVCAVLVVIAANGVRLQWRALLKESRSFERQYLV
jgi:hypothetical protein